MAGESDQIPLIAGNAIDDEAKISSRAESDIASTSSSSTEAIEKMAKKEVPVLMDYWKKSTVTEADHVAYHSAIWLPGGVESFVPD
jgi:hypothetical protein